MADLAQELLLAVELELIPHTPADAHSRPAARAATIAVLRKLADGKSGTPLAYHERKLVAGLADQIERGESRG